jgi:hypothetical protein
MEAAVVTDVGWRICGYCVVIMTDGSVLMVETLEQILLFYDESEDGHESLDRGH